MSNLQCRLCAEFKPLQDLLSIKNKDTVKLDLERKINECYNLTFEDLLLPKHVCLHCSDQVCQSFTFREKVLKAQEILQPCVSEELIYYSNETEQIKSEYSENEGYVTQHFLELEHEANEDAGFKSEDKSSDEDSDFQKPLSNLKTKKKTIRKLTKKKAVKTEDDESWKPEQVEEEDTDAEVDPKKPKLAEEIRLKIQRTREIWKNYVWKCTICDKQLPTLKDLRKHYPSSHNSKPNFACMECPKTFDVFRNFRVHVKTHREKYQCPVCQRIFFKNIIFNAHLRIHTTERNHMCAMCGKSFKTVSHLGRHRKTHSLEKFRYGCDICSKKLSSKSAWLNHQKIHQGIKEHICEHCGKGFSQKDNLLQHIEAIHTDKFAYSCTKCPKRFKTSRNLYKHMLRHSENRKHKCRECGRIFVGQKALDEHFIIHLNEMQFQCHLCEKKFKRQTYLRIHMRIHTGERPYKCQDCDQTFIDSSSLSKHRRKKHRLFAIPDESGNTKPVINQNLVANSITSGHLVRTILR